jgi:hypothetical protein
MARTDNLPVYKKTFELLLELHKIFPSFDRKYKFTLGSDCVLSVKNSLLLVVKVNNAKDKRELVNELLLSLHESQVNIRLLKNLNIIKNKSYFFLSEILVECLKQVEGWKKQIHQNQATLVA